MTSKNGAQEVEQFDLEFLLIASSCAEADDHLYTLEMFFLKYRRGANEV